ncbi:hypothetical protein B0I35DRAFT_444067 [Stachybotrys elegans]|uniref:DUF6594 domain-containing protein n=1 Tax=Stachybotrys elegans TaxID=80388 RepID=A0A8K0WLK9_9HYPO|nr:hypothetical protein B0I35DRAFT_444067 [Stachybotrys elegans]
MTGSVDTIIMNASNVSGLSALDIAERPWKYQGYKDFSSFITKDPDFFAVRRFGRLHIRALLTLQDHLSELEERLDEIDEHYSRKATKITGGNPPTIVNLPVQRMGSAGNGTPGPDSSPDLTDLRDINNGTIRDDIPERAELISKIASKLAEYDKLLLSYITLKDIPTAPKRNANNIKAWFSANLGAIMEEETRFIQHQSDLISGHIPKSALRRYFEHCVLFWSSTLPRALPKPPTSSTDEHGEMSLFSDQGIDSLGSVAVLVAALFMLIAPLWILHALTSIRLKLAVITSFVVVCLMFLSLATLGRPFERLAATAGYAAVLVVFLQVGDISQ